MSVSIGIEKIRVNPGTLALDMRTLVEARGGNTAEVCGEMMIDARSVNPPWEDPVTLAVNVCNELLTDAERASIGLLLVGTESGPDQEKAVSSWVRHYAGLPDHCRNLEIKHACYAATGALQLAANWLLGQPDGVRALVVATDESRQHFHRPWEYVMGAGAVAMLVSRDPRFFALELDLGGVYAYEVSDLTRPTSRVEAGHSETSLLSYLDAVDITFERYRGQVAARRGVELSTHAQLREWMPYQVYHAPFGGITARAHRALHRLLDDSTAQACRQEFDCLIAPTLRHNRRMGGTYAASVYISLLGAVDAFGDGVIGRRAGVYSYGSGSCAEFFGGVFGPDAVAVGRAAGLESLLCARRPIDVREYEEAERERTAFIDVGNFRTSLDGHDGWYDQRYAGRRLLTYRGADDYERRYEWELNLASAEIRLPERLDRAALAGLRRDVSAVAGQPVAIVRGASEDVFCRGLEFGTITGVAGNERDEGLADFEQAALELVTFSTRTVARVRGDAIGGGLGVAAACDVVIASENARFGLPEPLFGLIPGLVLPLIRSRIGGPALRRIALGGETIDAREAWRLGLVDEVVADDRLDARIAEWARRLSRVEAAASARLKKWIADMDDLPAQVAQGRAHLSELLGSAIVAERVGRYQRGFAPWEQEDDGTR